MTGTLDIYPRRDGKWAWRLRAANGRIIAGDMSQGYERAGAAHAIATRIIAGEFADAHVTATNHPDPGDDSMSDTTVTKYAVARRGKIITDLHVAPESAAAELEVIREVAAGIGITDSLKVVEVDVVTTVSAPREYEPEPEPEGEDEEAGDERTGGGDQGDAA